MFAMPWMASAARGGDRVRRAGLLAIALTFTGVLVAGCSGAFMGQCAVLAVTLCIFVGTLSLGRQTATSTTAAGKQLPDAADRTESI